MRKILIGLLAVPIFLAGCAITPDTTQERGSLEVVEHHIAALKANDVGALVSDYASDAVIMIELGVFRGPDEIRGLFEMITDEMTRPEIISMEAVPFGQTGDLIEEIFTLQFPDGTVMSDRREIFVVRGGKIVFQSSRSDVVHE